MVQTIRYQITLNAYARNLHMAGLLLVICKIIAKLKLFVPQNSIVCLVWNFLCEDMHAYFVLSSIQQPEI